MSVADGVFLLSSAVALAGALLAVGLRNIFHNILGFALAMLGVAGIFASLGSDFLAAVFVLVYVGAVAIAMVYAVMLSHPLDQPHRPRSVPKIAAAVLVAAGVAGALWNVLRQVAWPVAVPGADAGAAVTGRRFLTDYVLAFELISVLLVVAMMGAVMVARRSRPGRGTW
ncbi:MAG: NADH-quinone oxidoreductase subunit J [Gemmatimonadota bacterium]|nr:NADH-quinone oxidoreductase subunit J [Gemmatimonadota bacterium]MDH5283431.1 NADH-quinone oxidoreductase subunit J [Gemmatimonadota bacterium]